MIEDDIFKTTIPLVESFSADYNFSKIAEKQNLSELKTKIIECIKENPNITQIEIANKLNYSRSAIQKNLKELQSQNIVKHSGSTKSGIWIIN
ncbi:winged helix-turn-helix domain-containing protein [uncultured Treponema sp.]|uniref:winged helix-turn-helix domain-containing protein n=1 Tax=uncultured Treponema sp. TaxID=162155 RepID=UPI0025924ADA|nr:winged helix-turn-helix domain-containing protein [uncultured Treponema sp.]